jgi:hypothetical protein
MQRLKKQSITSFVTGRATDCATGVHQEQKLKEVMLHRAFDPNQARAIQPIRAGVPCRFFRSNYCPEQPKKRKSQNTFLRR